MKNQTNLKVSGFARFGSPGAAASVLWLAILAVAILVAGGWWSLRQPRPQLVESDPGAAPGVQLSAATIKILSGLEQPVDLRFFTPVDRSVLPLALRDYVTRVESLLAAYAQVAAGKVRVTEQDPQSDAAAKVAAGAAGVVPFATESGEIVYLGLTVGAAARIESIAPLAPEWEAALESDLSRAMVRVTAKLSSPTRPVGQTPAPPEAIDPALSEELLRAYPDLAAQSFDAVAKNLRERALEEFKAAAAEMQSKVSAAQKVLAAAQANNSEAAQQDARRDFQQLQAEQSRKLNAITARLQERITVLQQLKTAPTPSAVAR